MMTGDDKTNNEPQQQSRQTRHLLERTLEHALAHLDGLDHTSVAATASVTQLRSSLERELNDDGVDAMKVIDDLVSDSAAGLHGSAGGRFFGWVIGGSLPAALAADWLTSTWDQNAALYSTAPTAAAIESVCGKWLKDLLGLPVDAGFALVTGTQMAHLTCLAAARNSVLAGVQWDVERSGLFGAPRIRILAGGQRHGSVDRAVRLLGLGSDSVVELAVNDQGIVSFETLNDALIAEPDTPTIIVLQAGDLSIGAFDSFAELIPVAHSHRAWVHVDGAFGLWVAASPKFRHLVKDIHLADSWTVDGHKWLNVPYDCGYAFVADAEAHRSAMSHRANYLDHAQEARDQIDWNPEWSRRSRGFATYAAIRSLGRKGIADLIERTCRHAHTLVTQIGAFPGAETVWQPQVNQGLVRFLDQKPGATNADHNRRTDEVIEAIQKTGEAFFSGTTWQDKRCMRISVVNWQTSDNDVERTLNAVRRVLSGLSRFQR